MKGGLPATQLVLSRKGGRAILHLDYAKQ